MNRWTAEAWRTPLEYGLGNFDMDATWFMSITKVASEGDFIPFFFKTAPHLGAPFGGNWNDYPFVEQSIFFEMGMLASVMGLFPAVNFSVLLASILAAVSFYIASRALKATALWAAAGALVFAFTEYSFGRSLHHIVLTYYWHIPLCLLVVYWLGEGEGIRFGERRFWLALAVAAVSAVHNPYYTYMFLQLLAFVCLAQFFLGRRRVLGVGISVGGTAVAVSALMCAHVFLFKFLHGPNLGAVAREYQDLEFNALKLVDLIMPQPGHRFPPFSEWSDYYFHHVLFIGERPPGCAYLGLAGLAALGWLVFRSLCNSLSRPPSALPLEAFQVLWVLLYSVVGGITGILGITTGIYLFRCTNRFSIFILAIVLMYAVRRLSTIRLSPPWQYAIPILVVGIALWDQIPPPPSNQDIALVAKQVDSDRQFALSMEQSLPAGAMIFQLPIILYPEYMAKGVNAYEHLRPYLYTKLLNYSYGTNKGRSDEKWQQEIFQKDLRSGVDALESYGFSAIFINRKGFPNQGDDLIKALQELGKRRVLESADHQMVCVYLNPLTKPFLPSGALKKTP